MFVTIGDAATARRLGLSFRRRLQEIPESGFEAERRIAAHDDDKPERSWSGEKSTPQTNRYSSSDAC